MASTTFKKSVSALLNRALYITVEPMPRTLSERRAVLEALKQHSSVAFFKRLHVRDAMVTVSMRGGIADSCCNRTRPLSSPSPRAVPPRRSSSTQAPSSSAWRARRPTVSLRSPFSSTPRTRPTCPKCNRGPTQRSPTPSRSSLPRSGGSGASSSRRMPGRGRQCTGPSIARRPLKKH